MTLPGLVGNGLAGGGEENGPIGGGSHQAVALQPEHCGEDDAHQPDGEQPSQGTAGDGNNRPQVGAVQRQANDAEHHEEGGQSLEGQEFKADI